MRHLQFTAALLPCHLTYLGVRSTQVSKLGAVYLVKCHRPETGEAAPDRWPIAAETRPG